MAHFEDLGPQQTADGSGSTMDQRQEEIRERLEKLVRSVRDKNVTLQGLHSAIASKEVTLAAAELSRLAPSVALKGTASIAAVATDIAQTDEETRSLDRRVSILANVVGQIEADTHELALTCAEKFSGANICLFELQQHRDAMECDVSGKRERRLMAQAELESLSAEYHRTLMTESVSDQRLSFLKHQTDLLQKENKALEAIVSVFLQL